MLIDLTWIACRRVCDWGGFGQGEALARHLRLSLIEALAAAATVFQEGIADQVDEQGEGENLLVTPAPVVVEDLADKVSDTNGTRLSLTHWALRCYGGKHRHID